MRRWRCSLRVCLFFFAGLTLAGATRASGGNAARRISPTCCRRGGSGPTAVCLDWSIHCGCRRDCYYSYAIALFLSTLGGGLSGKFFDVAVFCNRCSISARGRARRARSPCRCTIALSFFNEEQMPAAGCLTGRRRLPRVLLPPFLPEELLWAARTIRKNPLCCAASPPVTSPKLHGAKTSGQKPNAGLSLRRNQNCMAAH